ncbi:MAG TPA: efflux transporter outer membrane subunit [Pseudomonadales bacterium]|nr:efflux transporter outer membrane subunit [Pseudomonadales bacterium]
MTRHHYHGIACSVLLTTLLTSSCSLHTPYQSPVLPSPAQWQEKTSNTDAINLQSWWTGFGDKELDALVTEALQSSLDLKQAQMRIAQARADLEMAGAAHFPAVNTGGSITRSDSSNTISTGGKAPLVGGPTTIYKAGFDASWEIDWLGRTQRGIDAAQARYDASVEDLRAAQITLLGEVAGTYIALRNNQQQYALAEKNLALQRNTLAITQERYAHGLTSYLDVTQAQAQLAATEAVLPAYAAASKASMRELAILLGYAPDALQTRLATVVAIPSVDKVSVNILPSDLLTQRPDLRREERKLAAASADIGIAKTARYPAFDLTMGIGLQSSNAARFADIGSRYWSLVPALSLPIFDGGKISANVDKKQAMFDEARLHYEDVFHKALQDVENALASFYAESMRSNTLRESESFAEMSVTIAQQRYEKGIDNFLNVLVAEKNLYAIQSSRLQADANRATAAVALYKALGGGWY